MTDLQYDKIEQNKVTN